MDSAILRADLAARDELNALLSAKLAECETWRLIARAALDQLALVATVPERYEQMQREMRRDREIYMAAALREGA